MTLGSGDAFVISSDVHGLSFGVSEVKPKTRPENLVLREGSLIITVERD